MTPVPLSPIAPLAALGLSALVAMVMAPTVRMPVTRGVAAVLFGLALLLVLLGRDAEPAATGALLAGDGLARFGGVLAILAGLGTLAFTRTVADSREGPALLAIATAGAVTLAGSSHAATLFLGLEITTLALVAMTLLPRDRDAVEAGYKLFLVAGIGAAALLLGAAFGFAASGRLDFGAWSSGSPLAGIGAALVLAGLSVKFSLVPFHAWKPDLFSGAPAAAASVAGAVSVAAVGVALLRLTPHAPGGPVWPAGLGLAGSAAVLLGNLVALRQRSLTRMLGYSSVAQTGYLALLLASGSPLAGEAALYFLAGYAPAVVAALCVAAALGPRARLSDIEGLAWSRPLAGIALAVALVSMAGLPPTAGFMAKVYLFSVLAGAHAWVLLGVAAAGSALAFFYYMRFAIRAVAHARPDAPAPFLGWPDRVTLGACLAALVGAGLYPEPLIALARSAALSIQ